MTETMPTSEVLNRAADLIEERGWVKGSEGWDTNGSLCIEGAILAVIGGSRVRRAQLWQCPAYSAVAAHLDLPAMSSLPGHWETYGVFMWNDAPERTATEVIEVLRACAVIEASREREAAEVAS